MEFKEEAKPFYQTVGKGKLYEQEEPLEKDRGLIHSYYPEASAYVRAFVEDACDRLDYEGSFIYDEYPDKGTIERTCSAICRQIEESRPVEAMERRRRRRPDREFDRRPERGILEELVGVLFCDEMHNRRCRRRRLKRFF